MEKENNSTVPCSIGDNEDFKLDFIKDSNENLVGEIVGLVSGAKKAAFLKIKNDEEITNLLRELKELAPERDFKTIFSNPQDWLIQIAGDYRKNVFIGEDESILLKLKEIFDLPKDRFPHPEVGRLLSYPDCCANRRDYQTNINELFEIGKANKIDYRNNNFYIKTDNNISLIRHYVCNYDCQKTPKYAQEVLNFLIERFPDQATFIENALKMPLLMVLPQEHLQRSIGDGGLFAFEGRYEDENTLFYSKVYYLPKHGPEEVDRTKEKEVLEKILQGNKIIIKQDGADVYLGSQIKTSIDSSLLVFIWPF